MNGKTAANHHLFTVSGCLTAEALEAVARNELGEEALKMAQTHIDTCEFCAVSLEGVQEWLKQHTEKKPAADIPAKSGKAITFTGRAAQIQEHVRSRMTMHQQTSAVKKSRRVPPYAWLSVAASVILFFGIYLLLQYRPFSRHKTAEKLTENTLQQAEPAEDARLSEVPDEKKKSPAIAENIPSSKNVEFDQIRKQMPSVKEEGKPDAMAEISRNEITVPVTAEEEQPAEPAAGTTLSKNENLSLTQPVSADSETKYIEGGVVGDLKAPAATTAGKNAEAKRMTVTNKMEDTDNTVFAIVDQMPEFPGGQQALISYLANHLAITEKEKQQLSQEPVQAEFVVQKDGTISGVTITRGASGSLKRKLINALKTMPAWNPGMQNNHAVSVRIVLPIRLEFRDNE